MTTIGNESRPAYVYDAETDTWVPIGVGPHTHDEYIDKTIITAKGDIIVGTALDAVAKLGVGTTGQVLVVNPSTATGLEWATISQSQVSGLTDSLNAKQNTITGAATTITADNLTANRAVISNALGKVEVSTVTNTELGYVSGVTSGIQTQINNKYDKSGGVISGKSTVATSSTVANGAQWANGNLELQATNATGQNPGMAFHAPSASAMSLWHPRGSQSLILEGNNAVVDTGSKSIRNITVSTAAPSGGVDGDVWLRYV
jgi:hypothetical protein